LYAQAKAYNRARTTHETDKIVQLATIFWAMWYEDAFVQDVLLHQDKDKDMVPRQKLRSFSAILGQQCQDLRNGYIEHGLRAFVVDMMTEWWIQ